MTELEMIKAFAELEGIEIFMGGDAFCGEFTQAKNVHGFLYKYNPVTDLDLTFKAMIKYEVSIDHRSCNKNISVFHHKWFNVSFSKGVISKSVIECILKSRGLWRD